MVSGSGHRACLDPVTFVPLLMALPLNQLLLLLLLTLLPAAHSDFLTICLLFKTILNLNYFDLILHLPSSPFRYLPSPYLPNINFFLKNKQQRKIQWN